MHQIRWSTTVEIDGTTEASLSRQITAQGLDSISVSVADAAVNFEIEVQPGNSFDFLLIRADSYSSNLQYRVNDVANPAIALDQPQVLAGAGGLSVFGAAPNRLFVSNATGADVTIQVLVGRDATP
jgi:hypothetical protein